MTTSEKIIKDLKALGRSGKQVAATLKKLGHKGYLQDPYSCPVALYLKSKGYGAVFVEPDIVFLHGGATQHNLKPIYTFIVAFDRRKYPDLMK